MENFESGKYQPCREWIAKQIDEGKSREDIKRLGVDASLFISTLSLLKDEEMFPLDLNKNLWDEYVDYYRDILISVQMVDNEKLIAIDIGAIVCA